MLDEDESQSRRHMRAEIEMHLKAMVRAGFIIACQCIHLQLHSFLCSELHPTQNFPKLHITHLTKTSWVYDATTSEPAELQSGNRDTRTHQQSLNPSQNRGQNVKDKRNILSLSLLWNWSKELRRFQMLTPGCGSTTGPVEAASFLSTLKCSTEYFYLLSPDFHSHGLMSQWVWSLHFWYELYWCCKKPVH